MFGVSFYFGFGVGFGISGFFVGVCLWGKKEH